MPGKVAEGKKRVGTVLPEDLIARADARAAATGTTRASVIAAALAAYLDGGEPPATGADLAAVSAKLDALADDVGALGTRLDLIETAVREAREADAGRSRGFGRRP